jgi:hypothetical protein
MGKIFPFIPPAKTGCARTRFPITNFQATLRFAHEDTEQHSNEEKQQIFHHGNPIFAARLAFCSRAIPPCAPPWNLGAMPFLPFGASTGPPVA